MSQYKKAHIPVHIKNKVWNSYCIYPTNNEITQCRTCDNLIMIPEAIRYLNNVSRDIKEIYVNGKIAKICGSAEFGHIISERNGGNATEDNLIVQCKSCNTKQGTKNILKSQLITDYIMIDAFCNDEQNVKMGDKCSLCEKILTNGALCKNKAIFNRRFCHIHLVN